MPDVYTISQLKQTVMPVFDRYGIRSAVLFGSYGKGTADAESDVDLLVDSGLHGLRFVSLLEDLRTALQKDVDLFDVRHIQAGSRLDREIQETGIAFYEK